MLIQVTMGFGHKVRKGPDHGHHYTKLLVHISWKHRIFADYYITITQIWWAIQFLSVSILKEASVHQHIPPKQVWTLPWLGGNTEYCCSWEVRLRGDFYSTVPDNMWKCQFDISVLPRKIASSSPLSIKSSCSQISTLIRNSASCSSSYAPNHSKPEIIHINVYTHNIYEYIKINIHFSNIYQALTLCKQW